MTNSVEVVYALEHPYDLGDVTVELVGTNARASIVRSGGKVQVFIDGILVSIPVQ